MKKFLDLVLCVLMVPFLSGSALAEDSPTSFTEISSASTSLVPEAPQKRMNSSQLAALTFYNNRAAFEAVVPGIPNETFESGLVGPGGVVGCPSSVSTNSPGSCFPVGSLLDGFSYTASSGDLVVLGAGVVGNPSTAIAVDLFAERGTLTFSNPDVFAVGFDLFDAFQNTVTLAVFSANGLEGQMTVPVAGGTFFGVISDTPITAVEVGTPESSAAAEVIDNLSFGEGCPCVAADSLFSDFVNNLVPVMTFLECRDEPDNTGVAVITTDGSVVSAASGTKGGRPNMCGTQVNNGAPNFIAITPGEDAACRRLLSAVCPD